MDGNRNRSSLTARVALSALCVCCAVGCSSSTSRQIQIESAAAVQPYNAVTINYRVDAGRRGLPMQLAHPHGQQVSFQQTPSSPYPDRSLGTLSIQYPHPDDRTGFALAELIIENDPRDPASQPKSGGWLGSVKRAARDHLPGIKLDDGVREAWSLDVPRAELDQVLARMAATGYFTPTVMAPQGVQLAAKIDGAKISKSWMQVPELDQLAQRIRDEGKLVSYMRPEGYVDPLAEPPVAGPYSQMMAQAAMMQQQPASMHYAPNGVPQVAQWPPAPHYSQPPAAWNQAAMTATNPFAAPQFHTPQHHAPAVPGHVAWQPPHAGGSMYPGAVAQPINHPTTFPTTDPAHGVRAPAPGNTWNGRPSPHTPMYGHPAVTNQAPAGAIRW